MNARGEYPAAPVVAVGALVFRGDRVLLVLRGRAPNAGLWSLPGGSLEEGETVDAAVVREVQEETGVVVRPVRTAFVTDYIERDAAGAVRWHYVLIDVLCEFARGEPNAASDAEDAGFLSLRELGAKRLTPTARRAIQDAASLLGV